MAPTLLQIWSFISAENLIMALPTLSIRRLFGRNHYRKMSYAPIHHILTSTSFSTFVLIPASWPEKNPFPISCSILATLERVLKQRLLLVTQGRVLRHINTCFDQTRVPLKKSPGELAFGADAGIMLVFRPCRHTSN